MNSISHRSGEMPVTDHNLVAVKVRERLSVNKQPMQTISMARLDVIKSNDSLTEEHNLHKILIGFAAERNLDANVDREEISVRSFKLEPKRVYIIMISGNIM